MNCWKPVGILSITLLAIGLLAPGSLHARSDGYTLEDFKLQSAGALADVCSIEQGHEHFTTALAFCYGFFEGAIRYEEALAGSKYHHELVCEPPETTRLEAVNVFVDYMKQHPQYAGEGPVDAIFRALAAKWPCPE